jgi:hypothetical protein
MMLSCREATRLVSESMDHPLPPGQRFALRFHLAMCRLCWRYREQVRFIRHALRLAPGERRDAPESTSVELPAEAKARIRRALGGNAR